MKYESDEERVARLKAEGVDVCDLRCAACGRSVCTGAAHMRAEAAAAEAVDAVDATQERLPLLRDPAVEMPDDATDVVVVLRDNDEGCGITTAARHEGWGWCETQDGQPRGLIIRSDMVAGWCHHHEAAAALRAAVRQ